MSDIKYAYPLILNKVTYYALGAERWLAAPLQLDPRLIPGLAKRVEVNLQVLQIVGKRTRRIHEFIEESIDLIEERFHIVMETAK